MALTLYGSVTQVLTAGSSVNIPISGTWTAANGNNTIAATVNYNQTITENNYNDNSATQSLYVGRGANMPYYKIEAESASVNTTGTVLASNYNLGDYAGEASGRSAVNLITGKYCEFTLTSPANALIMRRAVQPSTTGTAASIYVNGTYYSKINVTSQYSYLYVDPNSNLANLGYSNTPTSGYLACWLYDDRK